MYKKPINLTEFILAEEQKHKEATGSLTLLLTQIEYAVKIIASHIRQAGLVDILGEAGVKNAYQDEVKKIDVLSNDILIAVLKTTGLVRYAGSEELDELIELNPQGKYTVLFDPLDGSSNTDTNGAIGTIFSINHADKKLQAGKKQLVAGYALYGSSVMFVYTSGQGVNGFTLDPSIGSFLLSHPAIKIPSSGTTYSCNEGSFRHWGKPVQDFITTLKEKEYKLRYIGTMVADLHRILIKGGVFIHPGDNKNPQGKLRLLYEVNPFSFILEQAGGKAVLTDGSNPQIITPSSPTQQVPVVLGSVDEVQLFCSLLS